LREDLYYRLNVFQIELPPLRDRIEDIPMIAAAMIAKLNRKHGTRITHIEDQAVSMLQDCKWTGNIRELRNIIERAVILAGSGPILPSHLYLAPTTASVRAVPSGEQAPGNALGIEIGM